MEKEVARITGILTPIAILGITFLFLFKLGSTYLTNWDEAWYADIARNMARTGNLITPIWNHEPFFDKPPLYFWLSTLAFNIFGISEFSARFFSAISGIGVCMLVYFFGRTLFNKSVALLSLIILGSTIGFLYRSRTGNLDALLTFWIFLSIFSFYRASINRSAFWFLIVGLSVGLGFLTKGAISFVFPVVAILYLTFRREHEVVKLPKFWVGIFLGVAVALLWILVSFLNNREGFITDLLLNQTQKWIPSFYFWQSFSLDYMQFLKSGLKFWFILLIPSFFFVLFCWKKTKLLPLLVYFSFIFILLSFSENKSDWFLMPLYPLTSLMIGYALDTFTRKFFGEKFLIPVMSIIFLVAVLQNVVYKDQFIVADIAGDEAEIALVAKKLTQKGDVLYLTNYYYPTTVYYSERKTYAVYSEHENNVPWWVKPKTEWQTILRNERVFIITTREEFENFKIYFSGYNFKLLHQSGEKMLLKKV